MSAAALKVRLRADLKIAMQARATNDVRVLRTLIAAIDNAEAVPVEQSAYVPRAFGDPKGEVLRRSLDDKAIGQLLATEVEARLAAATDYERHEQIEEARRLHDEAALITRYATP